MREGGRERETDRQDTRRQTHVIDKQINKGNTNSTDQPLVSGKDDRIQHGLVEQTVPHPL